MFMKLLMTYQLFFKKKLHLSQMGNFNKVDESQKVQD